VFVAEFEIRPLGTNAGVKYKSSLLIQLLNLQCRAGAEADSSTQLKWRYLSADITQSPYAIREAFREEQSSN
jgi:hypothetical protein